MGSIKVGSIKVGSIKIPTQTITRLDDPLR